MERSNDELKVISMNSARKYTHSLPESGNQYLRRVIMDKRPDILFLPGDDKLAHLNVIRGYSQYRTHSNEECVLLFDTSKVEMTKPDVDLNALGYFPDLNMRNMVCVHCKVFTLLPQRHVVKEFIILTWRYGFFNDNNKERLLGQMVTLAQRLSFETGLGTLIAGEMNMEYSLISKIVEQLSCEFQSMFLDEIQPQMTADGYTPSITKYKSRDVRHLFMMKAYQCKTSNGYAVKNTDFVSDCFIASKVLKLAAPTMLDFETVTGRQTLVEHENTNNSTETSTPVKPQCPTQTSRPVKPHCPTQTSIPLTPRPPKHCGG